MLKQNLKDFQDMLKLTQTQPLKQAPNSSIGGSRKQHYQQLMMQPNIAMSNNMSNSNGEDGSFLKKLTRH
jgi:hypothetical protein